MQTRREFLGAAAFAGVGAAGLNTTNSLPAPIELEPLFTMTVNIGGMQPVGDIGGMSRNIFVATGGTFSGERLIGEVLPFGGDWMTRDDMGIGHIDVRLTLRTDQEELIYMRFNGILFTPTDADGQRTTPYFRTAPLFETASERLGWLNHTLGIATGTVGQGSVTYEVMAVL